MKYDQRVAITKRLLREGLLSLLKDKDISGISVTDLCLESGINRATFYRHYQQPRDIIVDIRRDLFYGAKELAERNKALTDPLRWFESVCRYFYEHADIMRILFRCRTDEEFVSFIDELYRDHFADMCEVGYARELDEDEMKMSAYCVAGGVYYVLRQWILEPIDKTPEQVASTIYRLLIKRVTG